MKDLRNKLRETLSTKEFNAIDFENNQTETMYKVRGRKELFGSHKEAFDFELNELKSFYGETRYISENDVIVLEVKVFAGYIL